MNTTDYFVVRNCVVENGRGLGYHGIYFNNVVNGKVENCVSKNNIYGIHPKYSNNNLISNNHVENNYFGIYPKYSDNNTLINNTCKNSDWYGIRLFRSDNNTLDNNTCSNNFRGIYLEKSGDVKMWNNTLSNNQYNFSVTGMTISHFVHDIDSSNLVNGKSIRYLVDNKDEVIAPPLDMGYLALVNCDNIRVENLALGNNDQGILLVSTKNSRMMNCVLENNFRGIHLYSSNNNFIYHNYFVSNENQACDDGSNYWDGGYPSGGNYWDDYTGVDNYRGENQDIPGSDGIGDTPYDIPGDSNRDRYPLMEPRPPVELSLVAGWNLVGFHHVSDNDTPGWMFGSVEHYVWYLSGGWKLLGDSEPFELGVGYWIWLDQDKTVTVPL